MPSPVTAPAPVRDAFGFLPDGSAVHRWTLTDGAGLTARILTYGAVLQALDVPDQDGTSANVVLGFDGLEDYLERSPYFGCVVGRYANRIADGCFVLDGASHRLSVNDGERPNTLHGGTRGFHTRIWHARPVTGAQGNGVELTRTSPHGEEGFPGTLTASVRYTVTPGRLRIDYRAATDAPTVVNLTNHAYFNLAGEGRGTVHDHELVLAAGGYLPVDEHLIPRGGPRPVAGTPFDFTAGKPLGRQIDDAHEQLKIAGGYDHCWALDAGRTARPRPVGRLTDRVSGRVLELHTTEPGIQVYTGNDLDGSLTGPAGHAYLRHGAVALETQHFPDSPNQPGFPSTVLRPGERYQSTTVLAFPRG